MNQSKGLKYGDVTKVGGFPEGSAEAIKPSRKRNTRKLARPIESEVVGQPREDTDTTLPESGEGDAVVETELDI